MKPKSQVKPCKCNICGLVLINTKELLKHKIVLHNDRIYQCQSCNKIFDTKYRFENHLAEIHDTSQNTTAISAGYDNSESSSRTMDQSGEQDVDNNMESVLFRKAAQEKKARKRIRGPYRKSVSPP
jgi:Zinc finger, C2H2 type